MDRDISVDKIKHKTTFTELLLIGLGVLMVASGIHFFLVPSNLSTGGASGLAVVLSHYIPLDYGPVFALLNIILFAVGFMIIGKEFGIKTVLVTAALSGAVWLMEYFLPVTNPLTDDLLLNTIMGTMLQGVGVGIVLNQYTSTGGTDIIAKILQKFSGLDLGAGCLITDALIVLAAANAFGIEIFLYSVIGIIVNSVMVSVTISGMNTSRFVFINSLKHKEISDYLVNELDRTANLIPYAGAYSKKENTLIVTCISNREYMKLKEYIYSIDSRAFVIVSSASEILGEKWRRFLD